ncbi:acyl carrier protein [Bacillus weihaiensis]|uniref:acyl carrier protein n=1 Tax=Bacillus weihaiensis TaxID=1547283 RepID=UPI002355040C|nr:acyl carrier protein [Bacillus weihaiensis]
MNQEQIFEKGVSIIVDKLNVKKESISQDSKFKDDLGADSLDVVELIMELEDEFEIEIADEDAESFVTVRDVVTYIQMKLA